MVIDQEHSTGTDVRWKYTDPTALWVKRGSEFQQEPQIAQKKHNKIKSPYLSTSQPPPRDPCENNPAHTNALLRRNCPACSKQFRLRWRIGKRNLEWSQIIRLTCPHCRNQFEVEGVKLIIFDAGVESFPVTTIVDESCLVPRK